MNISSFVTRRSITHRQLFRHGNISNEISEHEHFQDDSNCFPTRDILLYTQKYRPIGCGTRHPEALIASFVASHLPGLLKEKEFDVKPMNKIFAARWINDRQIVFGTKCNKLVVLDVFTKLMVEIPMLKSNSNYSVDCSCGIHGISVNPSRTLVATGGENVTDLAVYRLPTFDPVCVGEQGHTDWIFDVEWLDDRFVVTGSRDSKMALWLINDEELQNRTTIKSHSSPEGNSSEEMVVPMYSHIRPSTVKMCEKAEKVRAFAYNVNKQELAVLSLNAYVHLWDASTFTQRDASRQIDTNPFYSKHSRKLRHMQENVCMAINKSHGLYAIGSQSVVTLLDERVSSNDMLFVMSKQRGAGVRSVSFLENMMTIGTGAGSVFFYDLRAKKYLDMSCSHLCSLNVGSGYLRQDNAYYNYFAGEDYPNAVYVHSFDASGSWLFMAGGPLPAGLWGSYVGLWQ